jgi:hypothetical protein
MAMPLKLIGTLLLASMLTACGSGAKLTATPSSLAGAKQTAEQNRLLAEGLFTLPSTLVSVGSGGLVSVGSGHIVSTGSAMFRIQSLSMVPVADAVVALRRPNGAKVAVNAVVTDAQGRYRLMGAVSAGAYRLEATHAGQAYMTLANVSHFGSVDAPIDIATTLVSARLLAAAKGDLEVLAAADFQAVVALVRTAVEAQGLPAGWTPAQASETLAALEAATPALKLALDELETAQVALDARVTAFDYRLQSMAEELGVPAASLAAEARAILAQNPEASEAEVADAVRENRSSGQAGATPRPAAPSPTPVASPSAAPTASPAAAPTPSPAASSTPAATPTPAPTATPAPGGNKGNSGKGKGNNGNGNGNGNGNSGAVSAPSPTPSATPTAAPTAAPTDTPTPVASKTPCPTPSPSATPTPAPAATEAPEEEVGPPPGYDHNKWKKLYEKWKHKWKDHWNDHDKDED